MSQNPNPLRQFFRQPAIYFRLPSEGRYWPEDALELPPTQEIPVYPMTAIDEITYRTPDALFGGQATVNVIGSCIPCIHNAWQMPSVDVNAVLVAIRIASYGHAMDISSVCPSCGHEGEYTTDLRTSLSKIGCANYHEPHAWGDLEFQFRPLNYQDQNSINLAQFEQQKMISNIQSSDLSEEEKVTKLGECLQNVTTLTIQSLARCTMSIRTSTAIVTDSEHIEEFFKNCERKLFMEIRDYVIALREPSELPLLDVKCESCEFEFKQALVLDQTSFFGNAS
jgi:hypothetical protein